VSHAHFASVEILRDYLCQLNVENELSFIIVNIEDTVIHSIHP
jgi:UDP-N-acetylglucosamine 2-epimerase